MYWKNQNKKLTGELAVQIVERRLSGESAKSVGEAFGIASAYVNRLAKGIGWNSDTAEVRARFRGKSQ